MSIIFISDLHLSESHPQIVELFLKYLSSITRPANKLYILGDFFETWIGDDDLSEFNLKIIHALRAATDKGLQIFIMYGNRDFLIGRKFLKLTGCHLLPDEYVITLNNIPTLLMHGDTLCTEDKAYQKFRLKCRNPLLQRIFLWKSLKKRREIAKNYREKSQAHVMNLADSIMDVTQHAVLHVMQKHNVKHLIHGHTHRQNTHHFKIDHQPATRTVLGAWHEKGNALIFDENNQGIFIEIT